MLKRVLVIITALVVASLPAVVTASTATARFDDLTNPNRVLNGQYPTGVIDWGSNMWWLASAWGKFTTNSISFNGSTYTSGSFTFITPQRLLQIDAYNGGTTASTITFSCAGQSTRSLRNRRSQA